MKAARPEWRAAEVPPAAEVLVREGVAAELAPLLARRGVADGAAARAFLTPSLDQLHDPFGLAGMEAAVARLLLARERGETVAVVGDYDVDGVTATALLLAVLRACGVAAQPVLPHRMREGYGFQPVHVERAVELGCRVVLTADCGTSAGEAVERARAAGLDVLITDHHLPGSPLPDGAVLVNPRQAGCDYPFAELCGVGLALKLALAFAGRCGRALDLPPLLRIACLGTIADLVPLTGENRVIAALGLSALRDVRSAGLKALIARAGLRPPFAAADVAFRLGPRLNAAGRLDSADRALELLLTRDGKRAAELAEELETRNRERQGEEARAVAEARQQIEERGALPPILVAWSEGWHRGVVGVAAGRLAQELCRPALLLAVADGVATGSGRSVPGIALHAFLERWRERLERFGGHAQAVGLTVRGDRLAELAREWEEAAAEWPEATRMRCLEYELEAAPAELTPGLLKKLQRLEPHGQANPRPLLRTGPLRLDLPPRRFGNGHLSARARGADGAVVFLLGWGWEERAAELEAPFEALGHLEADTFLGGVVLRLADVRPV
ncbi:MAG TPA: single-stranded-DNA-specific exonuclease RecJ [Thermoanaerobaculia bacterium]|nr:single-stranded-DNA-specific exonuclease RecJ [Thermoanaerobaculia bacterium]